MDAPDGAGFVNHVTFALGEEGSPMFSVGRDSLAAQNLQGSTQASFLIRAPDGSAHGGSSVALFGAVEAVAERDVSTSMLQALSSSTGWSQEHLASQQWQRFLPSKVFFMDSAYATEAWVDVPDLWEAQPNLLAQDVPQLLEKLNSKHTQDLARFAKVYSGNSADVESRVLSVDHLGFDLSVRHAGKADASAQRVGLKVPPQTLEEAISAFTKLFQEAYAREQGWM